MPAFATDILFPEPALPTLAFFRTAYGALLLAFLLLALSNSRRFFLSERWGGYGESSTTVDAVQNPVVAPLVLIVWFACGILLVLGRFTLAAGLINLAVCRYFFVAMRWRGVCRGMGAPGFMTYWMAGAVAVFEICRAISADLLPLALLVVQVDLALIMLSSGIYKTTAGYPQNNGMQFGMANPEWGYWWKHFRRYPPDHWFFRFCNHSAWMVQLGASILLLIPLPETRFLGALLIIGSFAFVATQIRLGVLCPMVVLSMVVFFPAGSRFEGRLQSFPLFAADPPVATASAGLFATVAACGLWGYLVLLPIAYAGLYYNFYTGRSFRGSLQKRFEAYTNFFGLVIWRVFSTDVTNFYVRIHRQDRELRSSRRLLSNYDRPFSRFNHVVECITVTCVFTTLRYYPSDSERFRERLLRYARTLPVDDSEILTFEYISIRRGERSFEHIPVAEFEVDVREGTVRENALDNAVCMRRPHEDSPTFEGARPGSYVALKG